MWERRRKRRAGSRRTGRLGAASSVAVFGDSLQTDREAQLLQASCIAALGSWAGSLHRRTALPGGSH